VAGQAGTYWYHSHYHSQYLDGLRGALIVLDPANDPHLDKYDIDRVEHGPPGSETTIFQIGGRETLRVHDDGSQRSEEDAWECVDDPFECA